MNVSIITVTFNSESTIKDCISSVYNQVYKDFEHIIIDGASSDNTLQIIKGTPNRVSKIISEPDKGIYDALNKGIKLANGGIIGLLHSDDKFYTTNTINDVVICFNNTNADIVYGDLVYTQHEDTNKIIRYWKSKPFHRKLLRQGWMPPHPTVFMKKTVYEKHGLFKLDYKIAADYDLMLRVFSDETLNIQYLPQVITKMRVGGSSNKSLENLLRKSHEDYEVIKKNNLPYPLCVLFLKNISKIKQFFIK